MYSIVPALQGVTCYLEIPTFIIARILPWYAIGSCKYIHKNKKHVHHQFEIGSLAHQFHEQHEPHISKDFLSNNFHWATRKSRDLWFHERPWDCPICEVGKSKTQTFGGSRDTELFRDVQSCRWFLEFSMFICTELFWPFRLFLVLVTFDIFSI